MKQKDKKLWVLLGLLAACALFLTVMPLLHPGGDFQFNIEGVTDFSDGWHIVSPPALPQKTAVSLPARVQAARGEEVSVRKKLPDTFVEGMSVCIRTSMQSIVIKVDDDIIYSHGTTGDETVGKSPGSLWNVVRIPDGSQGKEITLTVSSPYQRYAGNLPGITYGSRSALLFSIVRHNGFGFVSAVFLLLFGAVLLVLYFIAKHGRIKDKGVLYLALFAVLMALWLLGESKMLQFFTGNQVFITCVSFLSLMLFPIPLHLFFETLSRTRLAKRFSAVFVAAYAVNFFVSTALQCFMVLDFIETLPVTLLLIIVSSLTSVVLMGIEILKYRNHELGPFALATLVLVIFGAFEVVNLINGHLLIISRYLNIGLLFYILLLGIFSTKRLRRALQRGREAAYFEWLAYRDLLTKGKNRTAYTRDVEKNYKTPAALAGVRLILFDLNDLKRINDTYGHNAGDDALIHCYTCIDRAFGKLGTSYRIGGDEFVCILPPCPQKEYEAADAVFEKAVENAAKSVSYPFSVAHGGDVYDQSRDNGFADFFERVDALMYRNKKFEKQELH